MGARSFYICTDFRIHANEVFDKGEKKGAGEKEKPPGNA